MFLPRRRRQHTRGPHRATAGAAQAPPPTADRPDEVVARAEGVVREMWLRALRIECEYTEAVVKAASARCEVARRDLVAALLGNTPGGSTAAGADLERRLSDVRAAVRAHNQAQDALASELGRWDGRVADRFRDDDPDRRAEPDDRTTPAGARRPNRLSRMSSSFGRLTQHAESWLVRLTALLTTSPRA